MGIKLYYFNAVICVIVLFSIVCNGDKLSYPKALKNTIKKDMKYWTNSVQLLYQAADMIVEGRVPLLPDVPMNECEIEDWCRRDIEYITKFDISKVLASTYDISELMNNVIQENNTNSIYILLRRDSMTFGAAQLSVEKEYILWLNHSPLSEKDSKHLNIPSNSTYTVLGGEYGLILKTDFNKAYYDNDPVLISNKFFEPTRQKKIDLLYNRFNTTNVAVIQKASALLCEAFSTYTKSNRIELINEASIMLSNDDDTDLLLLRDLRRFKVRNSDLGNNLKHKSNKILQQTAVNE